MAKRAIILLEGASNTPLYVKSAERLGLVPITISADPGLFSYLSAIGIEAIRVENDDVDTLIYQCSRLSETYDIAGITSAQETAYAAAGRLCRYFDLPGPDPEAIERCCDKFIQRRYLAEAGVAIPAYRLAADLTDVERYVAEIGLPAILKPTAGRGSSGVRLCRDVEESTEHARYLLGGEHICRPSPGILIEEFARGPHYSVDIMGNEVIGIAAADFGPPPHFVCREYIQPAVLTKDEHKRITDVSLNCLQALGLGWGPTNIDLRWTRLGPVVIEVNPRLAGSPTPQLVQLAYGVDLVTEHMKLVIGKECNLRKNYSHTAAARILVPDRDGILDRIDCDSRTAAVPGVAEVTLYIEPKTPILRRGDERDKIGHVIAASPTLARTKAALQRAVDLIDWSIMPFPTLGAPPPANTGVPDNR